MKKKKKKNKEEKIEIKKSQENSSQETYFETIDRNIVSKLANAGIMAVDVKSPFAERKEKLYVYRISEKEVNSIINKEEQDGK